MTTILWFTFSIVPNSSGVTDDELDDSLLGPEADGSDYDDPVEDADDEMDIINDADDEPDDEDIPLVDAIENGR